MTRKQTPPVDWPALLERLRRELAGLAEPECLWLTGQVALIGTLQEELDALFHSVGGAAACAGCDGACCDCGRHHLTATNLLACLLAGETPPAPDFTRPCPFLGARGCLLPAARRPYNCITFFCEALDERLGDDGRERLGALDRRLRAAYEELARRYPVASLRGVWLALEQVGAGVLLPPSRLDVLK